MVKMAVFAPMPRASVRIETRVKAGDFARTRSPYRRSCQRVMMQHLAEVAGLPGLMSGACAEQFLHRKRGVAGNCFIPPPPGCPELMQ